MFISLCWVWDTKDYLEVRIYRIVKGFRMRHTSKNERKNDSEALMEQSLSQDYWDGYYSLGNSDIAKFADQSENCASITIVSISTGNVKDRFEVRYEEDSKFSALCNAVYSKGYGKIGLRLSGSLSNPDREEMIESVLQKKDYFELLQIKKLIETLKTRPIRGLYGRIGNQVLSDGNYEGFYRLSDGRILCCNEMKNWSHESIGCIADGVAVCHILKPEMFCIRKSETMLHPYLDGDTFSDIIEKLSKNGIGVDSVIAQKTDELYHTLMKALDGDMDSASIASHRLRCNICVPNRSANFT